MTSILDTGKDGYDADREFDERTEKALNFRDRDDRLFVRDAVEVESFVRGDYLAVVPVLAGLTGYRILDLGCGYGRLCPLLTAFDCAEYLGVDRVEARIDYARRRYGGGVCRFEVADIINLAGQEAFSGLAPFPAVRKWCLSPASTDASVHGGGQAPIGNRPPIGASPQFSVSSVAGRFDVVWTSNVLQHLLLENKLRLVETALLARAPGGVILMREARIIDDTLAHLERRYAAPDHERHMIPIPFAEVARAFAPLVFRKIGGIVYMASEG